jgi:hypothetical protein
MQLVSMAPNIRDPAIKHPISSYRHTSLLLCSILALSPNPNAVTRGDIRLRQPQSDSLSRLPGVNTTLEHIRAAIRNSPSARTILLESSVGSGLYLADRRRLKISDIAALSRLRGGLAFLSACQTAMGDEDLSDEAIPIAPGMLFSDYGGVVGTMWSISDRLAPLVPRNGRIRALFRNKLSGGRTSAA